MFPVLAGSNPTGYNLTRSLRFRASASAYLNRTPASASNRKTWTWSGWIKRGQLGSSTRQVFFSSRDGTTDATWLTFGFDGSGSDKIYITTYTAVSTTTPIYRDPSSWYHVVVTFDTTQSTGSNRIKIYVNNVLQTNDGGFIPTLNADYGINYNQLHNIGAQIGTSNFDGYLTEVNFIDGQALTPSSFGSTNATTGVWQPARYTGTYGTNGFYLPFTDNSALTTSSNVGLGKDFSGNGNYWTTNNISITAGVTYDSMTDVPTLTSATAANFATLNPLQLPSATLSNGNMTASGGQAFSISTIGMSSGKFYAEMTVTTVGGESSCGISQGGYTTQTGTAVGTTLNGGATAYGYLNDGSKFSNGVNPAYGSSYTSGDVIGIAFDATAGTLTFYKNNTSQGSAYTGLTSGPYFFAVEGRAAGGTNNCTINFGQQPFTYTPPTGYVALNTYNLPTSTILQGNKVMDATLWSGTGAAQSIVNAGGFKPDLVWGKIRSGADQHFWGDSVRGLSYYLSSNSTGSEITSSVDITSLNSNGFTLGTGTDYNRSGYTFVGWQWQAGQGSSSSNTSGTITSTVSVNASAGFSVVTYTGTGANATVGHGLGVAPTFIIIKQRSISGNWQVYHSATGNTQSSFLNSTATPSTSALYWNSTSPTSSVFSLGSAGDTNSSGATYVAYCWTPISGFSSIGSYVGNGSNDGVFVYTGFLPKWLLVKNVGQANDWFVIDSAMNTYNVMGEYLLPNSSAASNTFSWIDFLSNGFKIRNTGTGNNNSGITQIYAAFASNPFKNSLAR